jgi:hypothetical protein
VLVPILVSLVIACGNAGRACAEERATGPAADYRVETPAGTLRISADEWKAMPGTNPLRQEFEQRTSETGPRLPRVVTVVKIHMTDDVRVGEQISPTEYLEIRAEGPSTATVQIRADKGRYWVMSRETLTAPTGPLFETPRGQSLTGTEFAIAQSIFARDIELTRFLLQSKF